MTHEQTERATYIAELNKIVRQLNDSGVKRMVEIVDFLPGCPAYAKRVECENLIYIAQWKREHRKEALR